jgi:hypothetical protein
MKELFKGPQKPAEAQQAADRTLAVCLTAVRGTGRAEHIRQRWHQHHWSGPVVAMTLIPYFNKRPRYVRSNRSREIEELVHVTEEQRADITEQLQHAEEQLALAGQYPGRKQE